MKFEGIGLKQKEQIMVTVFLKRFKKFRKPFSQDGLELYQDSNQY
jgi:hypothetical protein